MFLYLLENKSSGKYYIGCTTNIELRLIQHNNPNEHFTGRLEGNWKLLYNIGFENKKEARKEEIRLKKAKNKKYVLWYFKKFSA